MTGNASKSAAASLRAAWDALELQGRALAERARLHTDHDRPLRHLITPRGRWTRRCAIGLGAIAFVCLASGAMLWWLLATGPVPLGFATSWLTGAIEQRLGGGHRVEVGGTVLERDETGRMALRLRNIVVRDRVGSVVASAPKAEVGVTGLFSGTVEAERLSLIGAEMALRIERDGNVTIFAGADKSPPPAPAASPRAGTATPAAPATTGSLAPPPPSADTQMVPVEVASDPLAALLAWIDKLDSLGLDGGALAEVGLKDCTLVVDDRRSGRKLSFEHINLSLTRPRDGGVAFAINSTGAGGPWSIIATVTPRGDGRRTIETVARDVSPRDLMLALRIDDSQFAAEMPLSAVIRAEIDRDGTLQQFEGRVVAGAGYIGSREDADSRLVLDEAQLNLRWNGTTRQMQMPLEARSGASRISLLAQVDVPADPADPWKISIPRGLFVFASADKSSEPPLIIDGVSVRARIDPTKRRFDIEQGDLIGMAGRVALSGGIDYSSPDPRLMIGAASTRMTVSAFKRMWPTLVLPRLRAWVVERVTGGMIEKFAIATNAPLSTLVPGGPPVPDDGLSVELVSSGNTLRIVDGLPALRDADLTTQVIGRTATVSVGKAIVDLPSGRKITLTGGVFEVPDTHPKPSPTRTRFRAEGNADAAAELLSLERLRDAANVALDPDTTKGTFAARVSLAFPLTGSLSKDSVNYAIEADLSNFSAEKWVRGQKVEATSLRLTANSQGFQTKGDVKIAGLPATIEYRKPAGDTDAEIRMYATLDDAGRSKLGLSLNDTVTGPLPFKLHGRASYNDKESRYQVEADLKDVKVSELLPGWWKVAGKPAKVTFTVVDKPGAMRFEDIVIEGSGTLVKGMIELDDKGEIVLASFPTFALTDGDKATLRADRASDGTLKVTMRGDVFDGRGFIKASTSAAAPEKSKSSPRDMDIDMKVATVTGYNGEPLRGVELRMSRRNGVVRTFGMSAKLGRDSALMGDLRAYPGGRQVIYLETNDAGALLRFTDTYARVQGGQMWVAMDPPNSDSAPQDGIMHIRDFTVRNEPQLERVAANGEDPTGRMPQAIGTGVGFARMQVEFTRAPGRLTLRDGVVWGPAVGATLEGTFDYAHDDVRLRGTFVPAYALNNFLARFPIVGLFLGGGQNEGVFGVPYEVAGTPSQPVLRVNPAGMFAPGILRKLFEFRRADETANAQPYPTSPTR